MIAQNESSDPADPENLPQSVPSIRDVVVDESSFQFVCRLLRIWEVTFDSIYDDDATAKAVESQVNYAVVPVNNKPIEEVEPPNSSSDVQQSVSSIRDVVVDESSFQYVCRMLRIWEVTADSIYDDDATAKAVESQVNYAVGPVNNKPIEDVEPPNSSSDVQLQGIGAP